MSHKYDVWFCQCGRIHFHPSDDLDWMSEDCENRRVLEVCRNCGHIHEQYLTESFYGMEISPHLMSMETIISMMRMCLSWKIRIIGFISVRELKFL